MIPKKQPSKAKGEYRLGKRGLLEYYMRYWGSDKYLRQPPTIWHTFGLLKGFKPEKHNLSMYKSQDHWIL